MKKGTSRSLAALVVAVVGTCTWVGSAEAFVTSASRQAPLPRGLVAGSFDGISCPSTRFCVAVGFAESRHGRKVLIERWNGAGWRPMQATEAGEVRPTELEAVDCRSKSECVAVGYTQTRHGSASVIERWNGIYWDEMESSDPKGRPDNALGSVSCSSSNACMAVGYSATTNGPSHALVKRWNGSRWAIMRIHHWGGASDNQLLGVSCPARRACFAVGVTNDLGESVIQHWNGYTWTPAFPNDDGYSGLSGVYCLSARSCLAVGGVGDSSGNYTDVDRWNGHTWKNLNGASWNEGDLYAIACSHRVRFCAAVGDNVQTWTGEKTWSDRVLNGWSLQGVSCAGRMCMAVGDNGDTNEKPVSMLMRDN